MYFKNVLAKVLRISAESLNTFNFYFCSVQMTNYGDYIVF